MSGRLPILSPAQSHTYPLGRTGPLETSWRPRRTLERISAVQQHLPPVSSKIVVLRQPAQAATGRKFDPALYPRLARALGNTAVEPAIWVGRQRPEQVIAPVGS